MNTCAQLAFLSIFIIAAILYRQYNELCTNVDPPKLSLTDYWGPGSKESYKENDRIQLQKVVYFEEPIERLAERLKRTDTITDSLEGVGFQYGVNSDKLKSFIEYWRDDYLPRWKWEREHRLNLMPHFLTTIQGLTIHYIHTKVVLDENKKRVPKPVLMLHGWPGSVIEFYDIIPMLASPENLTQPIFEVVAPSLPGYAWSEGSAKPGFGIAEMAVVLRNLMIRLGYTRFYIQGGDWGSLIGSAIATLFPENVIGYHSNMCAVSSPLAFIKGAIASFYPPYFVDEKYEDFYFPLTEKFYNLMLETGYFHIQATKPDTIGIALTDNPIGLAAYILEKFATWTYPNHRASKDGGLDKRKDMQDLIIDNIMIYYLTNSITTSMRLYAESLTQNQRSYQLDRVPTDVPTGCARFKNDIAHSFDWQLIDKFRNLIHSTHYRKGGHFAALEVPEVLFKDFIMFVEKVEKLKK